MITTTLSATNVGFNGTLVTIDCDSSNGLPTILLVGLGSKAIEEAKERVRSAIKNTGLSFPRKRLTINLSPANLPKHGTHFDLPIAISILSVSDQIKSKCTDSLLVGELALDGTLRPVTGIIGYAETALKHGLKSIIVPELNADQASLVAGLKILPAKNLSDVYLHLTGKKIIQEYIAVSPIKKPTHALADLNDIKGQEHAKRALIIAAAGGHNLLLSGPPGSGKTMLAKSLASIMPPLSNSEIIEVTKIHSLAGGSNDIVTTRPLRAPHHSTSYVALVGGGQNPKPGEISLAHRGVLFLDEIPEYSRQALESLRQPLEDKIIRISRANESVEYPANFMLIATRNPCPCGYYGDPSTECRCSMQQILNYQKRLSGPLLDRIDLHIEVSRVNPNDLLLNAKESTLRINFQQMVGHARNLQYSRFGTTKLNSDMSNVDVNNTCHIDKDAKSLLNNASTAMNLSARAYFKTIKVARTIADLNTCDTINTTHIAEALQYRARMVS